MKLDAVGVVVFEGEEVVSFGRLRKLEAALGTASAAGTAALVPWFGPTIAGEGQVVEALGMDLSKALLGGLSYRWERPFEAEETVTAKVFIESVSDKGTNRLGVVVAEFKDKAGQLIHRQSATFIEATGA